MREATRYARWAAAAAVVLAVIAAASYFERAWRAAREQRNAPPAIPSTVEQRSAEFTFSKIEGNRTLFTVRASRSTEYKAENRNLLEDVWITIYGRAGERNDNIHTQECSYEAAAGRIACQGEVQLDLASAGPGEASVQGPVHLETRNISFDRNTGVATTPAAVRFSFPAGKGQATGLTYDTREATITLARDVQVTLARAGGASGPVILTAGGLAYRRRENRVALAGPIQARQSFSPSSPGQGWRELTAGSAEAAVDAALHPERVTIAGSPEIISEEKPGRTMIRAERFLATFSPGQAGGKLAQLVGEGNVHASRAAAGGSDELQASRAEIAFAGNEQPEKMIATGAVRARSESAGQHGTLETSALAIEFASAQAAGARFAKAARGRSQVRRAEAAAGGTISWKTATESLRAEALELVAEFGAGGRLRELRGAGGTHLERQAGAAAAIESASNEFRMEFARGDWMAIDQSGQVAVRQGPAAGVAGQPMRTATADRAHFARATGTAVLTGHATMSDATSRTQADRILFDQTHDQARAEGNVRTSYFSGAAGTKPAGLGQGPAQVVAAALVADTKAGRAVYSGGARLWQSDATIQADTLTLERTPEKLDARGHASGTFLGAESGRGRNGGGSSVQPQGLKPESAGGGDVAAQTATHQAEVWRVSANEILYRGDESRAWLTGGASAATGDARLTAPEIALEFERSGNGPPRVARASATGGAMLRQEHRWVTGSRADYDARDDKIVFSGGPPALHDASGNLVRGRQLTLFLASDTILVVSEPGGGTFSKYRIAK